MFKSKELYALPVIFFLFLLIFPGVSLAEETITITTYYPSPYGVYREMRAKRIAIGDTYFDGAEVPWEETDGDGGQIDYNADLVVEGNVGIGTTMPKTLTHIGKFSGGSATMQEILRLTSDYTNIGSGALLRFTNQHDSGTNPNNGEYNLGGIGAVDDTNSWGASLVLYSAPSTSGGGNLTERVRITSTGYVGIGTTNPLFKNHIASDITMDGDITSSTAQLSVGGSTTVGKRMLLGYDTNGNGFSFIKAGNYAVTWTPLALQPNGGNVGIGLTDPGYKLTLNGQPAANGYTAWTNYSDRRLKKDIKKIEDGTLAKIMKLNPTTFSYNDKYFELTGYSREDEKRKLCGFVAQDMQKVFPEMVSSKKFSGESYLDTNLTNLQVYLVKAMQEQQEQIEGLKLHNRQLEERLNSVEEKIKKPLK